MAPTPTRTARTARKATAPKPTPPGQAPAAPAAPKSAPFDFGALTVTAVDKLPSSGKRGIDVANTPFPAAVDTSWREATTKTVNIKGTKMERTYGSVQSVTVPESMTDATVRLIRRAADHLDGVGVRVVPSKPTNGMVTIAFRAQTKRAGSDD